MNGENIEFSSNSVKVEVTPQSDDDSKLWAELSNIGIVELIDGPGCTVFENRVEIGYGSNEAAILAAEKHKNSSLYPYVMSYTSDTYWPIHSKGKTDSISDLLADFMVKKNILFSSSDPYLYLSHLIRTSFYELAEKNTEVFSRLHGSVLTMNAISKNSKAELKFLKNGGRILNLSLPSKFNSKKIIDPQIDMILDPSIMIARQKKLRELREKGASLK